jgi:hypothetical protein
MPKYNLQFIIIIIFLLKETQIGDVYFFQLGSREGARYNSQKYYFLSGFGSEVSQNGKKPLLVMLPI